MSVEERALEIQQIWKNREILAEQEAASRNLQSYLSTTRLRKLTVVFQYYEAIETYSLMLDLMGDLNVFEEQLSQVTKRESQLDDALKKFNEKKEALNQKINELKNGVTLVSSVV